MNYKSISEAMKRVPVTATDEIFIDHEVWETIIYAMDDMIKKIEKLESRKGGMLMDKKTKDALITIVRHVLDSDKKTEDHAAMDAKACEIESQRDKYREDNYRLMTENRTLQKKYDKCCEEYEFTLVLLTECENKCKRLGDELQELQEQADIDKMQIALYDKENKKLRENNKTLVEIFRKAMYEAMSISGVPEESVYSEEYAENETNGKRCMLAF